ncbi:MAG: 4,5-dihydroxyphthalate decarboxylase [Pseudomonadota bacterium]|nr:4,5-dihydroxyphthalate decarboxylase [Pseudomonadota bacterium]
MKVTLALERYERHIPFFLGQVKIPSGVDLIPVEVGEVSPRRDGTDRHNRMLKHLEFDVCEMSLGSFILGKSRDPDFPFIGVPVFPRRYFSLSQIFVNANSGIDTPRDLVGRNVGINAFQVTLSVLAKGDLSKEYDVPWQKINWKCMRPEQLPLKFPENVSVEPIPPNSDIGEMLVNGEIDALISPQQPSRTSEALANAGPKIRRLFKKPEEEDKRYFKKNGFFPVMHLLVIRDEVAKRLPSLSRDLILMWEDAKKIAYKFYEDPNYSMLAWSDNVYRAERAFLAPDLWPSGVEANRKNLDLFLNYCADQGLMDKTLCVNDLFDPLVINS